MIKSQKKKKREKGQFILVQKFEIHIYSFPTGYIFKIYIFFILEADLQSEKGRQRSSICWLIPQIAATARVGLV